MTCKTCKKVFIRDSEIPYDQCDNCFLIENDHALGMESSWDKLSESDRQNIFKYLKLMRRFMKNPNLLSRDHKKWMLDHCDLPTELVPNELMEEYWL